MSQNIYNWPEVQLASSPIAFEKDGSVQTVILDTATPAGSEPLPVQIMNAGAPIDVSSLAQETTLQSVDTAVTAINGKIPALGQTTMSGSLPVTIASDQTSIGAKVEQSTSLYVASNSTTTPLGVSGVFTGAWTDASNYSAIQIGIYTDQNSATLGIEIQFSYNGVIVDHKHQYTYESSSDGVGYTFQPEFKYFRLVYTNGTVAQTTVNIYTAMKPTAVFPSQYRVEQAVTGQSQALVTKGVIYGLTTGGGGGYVAVKVAPSGALTADVSGSSVSVSGTVAVTQSTSPWVTSNTTQGSVTGGTAGTTSALGGGIYNSSAPSLTNGQQASLQLEATGSLRSAITGVSLTPTATFAAATVTKSGLAISSLDNSLVCALHPSYALPTGANTIGSIASINNALPVGSNTIGGVTQSGTWNIGTLSTISNALPAGTNTLGNIKITDGTNTAAVKAASTAAVATDPALVVAISPNNPLTFNPSPNAAGSYAEITNLTTTAQTFTKPTNAVGFILETLSDNTVNVRYKIGATATTTSGMRMEPGRDTGYVPCAANISVIAESGTNQVVTVQWVLSA